MLHFEKWPAIDVSRMAFSTQAVLGEHQFLYRHQASSWVWVGCCRKRGKHGASGCMGAGTAAGEWWPQQYPGGHQPVCNRGSPQVTDSHQNQPQSDRCSSLRRPAQAAVHGHAAHHGVAVQSGQHCSTLIWRWPGRLHPSWRRPAVTSAQKLASCGSEWIV